MTRPAWIPGESQGRYQVRCLQAAEERVQELEAEVERLKKQDTRGKLIMEGELVIVDTIRRRDTTYQVWIDGHCVEDILGLALYNGNGKLGRVRITVEQAEDKQ